MLNVLVFIVFLKYAKYLLWNGIPIFASQGWWSIIMVFLYLRNTVDHHPWLAKMGIPCLSNKSIVIKVNIHDVKNEYMWCHCWKKFKKVDLDDWQNL